MRESYTSIETKVVKILILVLESYDSEILHRPIQPKLFRITIESRF